MPVELHYPSSTPDRGTSTPFAGGLAAPAFPRARVWPWLIGSSANLRTTIVSQSFQTPCMIWEIQSMFVQAGSGAGGVSMFYSTDDSGAQTAGAAANRPTGTPVFDPISFRSNVVADGDTIPEHWAGVGEGGTVSMPFVINPRKIIDQAGPVFLKLSVLAAAGEIRTRGFVVVFEAADVDTLLNFL
jgi:hypothetical protein